jgi:hypothetical protein
MKRDTGKQKEQPHRELGQLMMAVELVETSVNGWVFSRMGETCREAIPADDTFSEYPFGDSSLLGVLPPETRIKGKL